MRRILILCMFFLLLLCSVSARGQSIDRRHVNVVNALEHGTACNSTTLNAAISSIGSSDPTTLLVTATDTTHSACTWTPTASVTSTSNITLWIPPSAQINCNGQTVTLNGPIDAGDYQIFTNCASGLTIAGPINAAWFGNDADALTDAQAAAGGEYRTNKATFHLAPSAARPAASPTSRAALAAPPTRRSGLRKRPRSKA